MKVEAQTTLSSLQIEMRGCRRCLNAGFFVASGAVFSGNAAATVMLIGQAPGITEAKVKRPFNAGSGRRLFKWLGAAGWEEEEFRSRHYMTAVTKCYPGRSKNGKGDRVPSKPEQKLCRPFLEGEIREISPRLIILVGGLAIKLFYPNGARLVDIIGKSAYFPPGTLRDPVNFDLAQSLQMDEFDAEMDGGRWLVPLPHPSGASLWPNKPENRTLINNAILILGEIREQWKL